MLNIRISFSNKLKMLFILVSISSLTACNGLFSEIFADSWEKEEVVCDADTTDVTFKQVAYWLEDQTDNFELVDYDQLTHLNYGYLEVNTDGSLADLENSNNFEDIIAYAQAQGVKVAISIGGDGGDSNLNIIAADSELTDTFVDNVIDFVDDYDLDGVDLSWQFPDDDDEGELFEDLVKELSAELEDNNKFFSIAVVSGEDEDLGDAIVSSVFAYVDFVNVMAFDSTNSDDLHSSMQDAIDAINYWTGRCLIKNKLVVGIPFYSRGKAVRSYAYIIDDEIEYACVDESEGRDYNGIPTVIEKTEYAQSNAGGVMMMSLEQDTYESNFADYSLLHTINEQVVGNDNDICD